MKDILLPLTYLSWLKREVRAEMFAYGETLHEAVRNLKRASGRYKTQIRRNFKREYQDYVDWFSNQSKAEYLGQGDNSEDEA